MKIGIITFHSAHNYGAVLQAWSTQEYLRQQGHEVEMVNLRLPVIDSLYEIAPREEVRFFGNKAINHLANRALFEARCVYSHFVKPGKPEKYKKFENFINHKLLVTKEFRSYGELKKAKLHYDALIVGSDQVWNAVMMKGISPAYFLQFANADALRISYAASIGTEEIPQEYHLLFRRYLKDMDVISVREKKAQEEVQKLTDKPVEIAADPTFLLKREDFERLKCKSKISGKYIYVHNVHLKRVDEALNSVAEEISRRLDLPIVHNWKRKIFSREAGQFSGGIEEFLGLVSEAEYVITNSFHCTVFAIIFQRSFITVPHFKHPDRMRNLLESLGIPEHLIGSAALIPEDLRSLEIDYREVEKKKEAMGAESRIFLDHALQFQKEEDNRNYFEHKEVFRCYGCRACEAVCPTHAIRMAEDEEGFVYPVIDDKLCTDCGKCREACIYHKKEVLNLSEQGFPEVYAVYSREDQVVEESSAGGAFTAMYRNILKKGGVVAGARYNDDLEVVQDLAETEEECRRFRGPKYIEAESKDLLLRIKEVLEAGREVLYSGTPCQIAGLKSFLGREYPKLYTVEVICHGVGSPKIFRKYRKCLEEAYQSKMVRFDFQNKFKGMRTPFILSEYESGSIDVENAAKNDLGYAYKHNNIQRPSCYTCEYVGNKAGVADITIGDYKGSEKQFPEFYNPKGVSVVKVNTPKGKAFFEECRDALMIQQSTFEKAYARNYRQRMEMTGNRTRLMYEIDHMPADDLLLAFNEAKADEKDKK